jgi:O-antigen ligase
MVQAFDRRTLGKCADWCAVAIAIFLPWSTTITIIVIVLWFVCLLGSWNLVERSRERWRLAGALPVGIWVLGLAGMFWAAVPLADRLAGLDSFHKFLAIPFLAIQFRESERGFCVLIAFLISCTVLLAVSWGLLLIPDLPWRGHARLEGGGEMIGIPAKDRISQSTMFTLCILGLAEGALFFWQRQRRRLALALVLLALLFLANILYVGVSRTALIAVPLLLLLFAFRRMSWKGTARLMVACAALLAVVWATSADLRQRVMLLPQEVRNYQPSAPATPAGERLEYWRKSVGIIASAPIFGHGTGSIREEFRQAAAGQTGMAAETAANPHNQIFAMAIQLGVFGALALLAMWTVHVLFF